MTRPNDIRRLSTRGLLAGVLSLGAAVVPSAAAGNTLTATPKTIDSAFTAARGGDTIELGSGNYGTFDGAAKGGPVTLKATPGANARIQLDFIGVSNITIDGMTITQALLSGSTHDIVVRNSDIPGQVTLRTGELQNSNILFENNVHHDWDKCDGCGEGRVFLPENTDQPSGITIRNSIFTGGVSDGILNGSNGTQIIGNTFHDLRPGTPDGVHTDAIQLYGSKNTLIRGNYFYNVPSGIMSPDGADHEVIEDNVFRGDTDGYPFVIMILSDNGSIIRHNTLADGDCTFNLHCGILAIGSKPGEPAGRGTVIQDNILGEVSLAEGSATVALRSHNLIAHDRLDGQAEIRGKPTYAGGSRPVSYADHTLAAGSLGKGNASDGLDRGARIDPAARTNQAECKRAKRKVQKLKHKLVRAKRRLQEADGKRETQQARKHLHKVKRKLRDARERKHQYCMTG